MPKHVESDARLQQRHHDFDELRSADDASTLSLWVQLMPHRAMDGRLGNERSELGRSQKKGADFFSGQGLSLL